MVAAFWTDLPPTPTAAAAAVRALPIRSVKFDRTVSAFCFSAASCLPFALAFSTCSNRSVALTLATRSSRPDLSNRDTV